MEDYELRDLEILGGEEKIFSPKSDFVFKNIFGDPNNKDIVIGFLKAILDMPHDEYVDIEFSNTFLNKKRRDGKYSILDLVITTKNGHKIDVEIQRAKLGDFEKRVVYYSSRLASDQLDSSEQYENLCRSIVIFILDHDFFEKKKDKCFTRLRLCDVETGDEFTDVTEVDILELPKVPKDHVNDPLYDWADFFNAKTVEDLDKVSGKSKSIKKAVFNLKKLSADEEFKAEYEYWLKYEREKYLHGKKGFQEGLEVGVAKGETKKAIELAAKLVKTGKMSLEEALSFSGLDKSSEQEIKTLLNEKPE